MKLHNLGASTHSHTLSSAQDRKIVFCFFPLFVFFFLPAWLLLKIFADAKQRKYFAWPKQLVLVSGRDRYSCLVFFINTEHAMLNKLKNESCKVHWIVKMTNFVSCQYDRIWIEML